MEKTVNYTPEMTAKMVADYNDLQLYINVAKKLNMKKYKPPTAHNLIAKKMVELVDVVDDDKVDYARHMARKAQGLPSMLD